MPSKTEKQRKAMAVSLETPHKLYKRNKGMADMDKEDLRDFARKPTKKKGGK